MARSLLAVVCAVLALCASPVPVMEHAFEALPGADGCCDTSCCWAAPTSCGPHDAGAPQLVNPCGCGHQHGDSVKAAPAVPRTCSDDGATLAAPQPRGRVLLEAGCAPVERDAAPEPPPPRGGDRAQAQA